MTTATINLKIDSRTKTRSMELANELGISLSSLIDASLRQIIRDGGITLSVNPRPSEALEKVLKEAQENMHTRKGVKSFKTADAMFAHLDNL